MQLKILAISDTHLGEETSLLSFPHGRQHLWRTLRTQFGSDNAEERIEIEELILLGDIPDRTLSSTSQIITHTNAFIQMLGSAATIKKGVYIPGNHDHTLWTRYCRRRYGQASGITGPAGDLIVERGVPCDEQSSLELLSIFFGYPAGSSWRAIQRQAQFDFVLANPVYATTLQGCTYVFTHGTHFRQDVTSPVWMKRIADYLELDEVLGRLEIESGGDVTRVQNLAELEAAVTPFVDSLWPSSKNNPTSRSDQLWYLLSTLSGKFGRKRPIPAQTRLFSLSHPQQAPVSRIRRLTTRNRLQDDSLKRWQIYFLPHLLSYLEEHHLLQERITFVYGDTHDGGWGTLIQASGQHIHLYNCGGWVVHNAHDHPACHLFVVDEQGEEYLLDVSFRGVEVEGESLLELAARDAENRQRATSRIMRFLLKLLPFD